MRFLRRHAGAVGVTSLYGALAAYLNANLLADPTQRLPFFMGDGLLTLWNYWWARWALVVLRTSPLTTTYLSSPHATSLVFAAHDLLHGVLSLPLQAAMPGLPGLILSVNVMTLLCYVLSATAAYAWFCILVESRPAAVLAGFGYAFSAFHAAWAPMPVLGALYWLPLFAALFLRAVRRGGVAAVLWPGLCFGLCTFQSLYYTLFLTVLAVFLVLFAAVTEAPWPRVRRRLLALTAAMALFCLPMGVVVVSDLSRTRYAAPGAHSLESPKNIDEECNGSIDLAGIVIPGPNQGLWRRTAEPWNDYLRRPTCPSPLFGFNGVGGWLTYVGVVPLILAGLAWRVAPRRVALMLTLGTLFFVGLALGPFLHLYGDIYRHWWLPLPYRLLFALPPRLSKMYHGPYNFWVLALFGIWTLAAFGMRSLLAAEDRRQRWAWLAVLVGWLFIDYYSPPLPAWPIFEHGIYEQIAADPAPVTVLELPVDNFQLLEVYNAAQAIHHKPLARGFLARTDPEVLRRTELINAAQTSGAALDALLDELGPVYVVVRKKFLNPAARSALPRLLQERAPDGRLSDANDQLLYRIVAPRQPRAADGPTRAP